MIGDISNGCTVNTDVNFNLSLLHFNIADKKITLCYLLIYGLIMKAE